MIAELAHGFELSRNPADGRPWTVVVDKLSPKQPGFIAQEVAFLKKLTKRRIKATLPAPALLGERMWDPEKSAKAYPQREDFVRDCVPILRREVELLRDEGVSIVQIDDPHLCLFVDPDVRRQYDDAGPGRRLRRRHGQPGGRRDQRREAGRAPVPPGRRAGPRRGRASRRLRSDPPPAQPAEGESHHDGIHRARRRRHVRLPRAAARTWRSAWAA